MRVLRIGTSNDYIADIPEDQHGWAIAGQMLGEVTGQPVETVLKRAWPTEEFPAAVARWMEEFQPDFVVLHMNTFWYGHESVALWFQRKFGRAGERMTKVSLRVGKTKLVRDTRWGQVVNRSLLRILPGDTYFTTSQVAEAMEAGMRKVIADEGALLLVRGADHWEKIPMATARHNRRNGERREAMSAAMRVACERLRVPYCQRPPISLEEMDLTLGPAKWHTTAEGERFSGVFDGEHMVAVWRAAQAVSPATP